MQVEYHSWWSRHLARAMALKVYGHWGVPYIVFPCSRGRFFDYEGMGMIAAVEGFIQAGKIKLFTVDSIDAESWYDFSVPPAARNARHEAYDRYVVEEVVPFIRDHCHGGPPGARALCAGLIAHPGRGLHEVRPVPLPFLAAPGHGGAHAH